jgi:hypothetical protein
MPNHNLRESESPSVSWENQIPARFQSSKISIQTAVGFSVETFKTFETLFLRAAPPHGHARIPAMNFFLEIAS